MDINRISLRMRITIFTIFVVLVSSAVMVLFINLNVDRIIPNTTSQILVITNSSNGSQDTTSGSIIANGAGGSGTITPNPSEGSGGLSIKPGDDRGNNFPDNIISGTSGLVSDTMLKTRNQIRYGSMIILGITAVFGGIAAYFISAWSLKPVSLLSRRIKNINTSNLSEILPTTRANDEIKELSLSFNSMLARLNHAFESQNRFNVSVAHELKTPLTVIISNIGAIQTQEQVSQDEYAKLLSMVNQSAAKMNMMIESLLEMVRPESSSLDDNINLANLVSDVCEDLSTVAESKNIVISNESEGGLLITGNEILLYRAVYNVMENAIKYSNQGGKIVISCKEGEGYISLVVKDTGIGISEDKIDKLFEPFYRIKSDVNGFGLGLTLTKSVIQMHGGEIKVKSEINLGTTFTMKLPSIR